MFGPSPRIRRLATTIAPWGVALAFVSSTGCSDRNTGVDPRPDQLFFPAGLLLDPRPRAEGDDAPGAKYLFVSNGNNDRAFNGGTVVALDLDAFFSAWQNEAGEVEAYDGDRCVLAPGATTDAECPCRRLAITPQVVECDEEHFVVETLGIGDFATGMAVTTMDDPPRVFLPVRGGPSINYFEVKGENGQPPVFDCVADNMDVNEGSCADSNRLKYIRNDNDLDDIPREPFNVFIQETEFYRYAFVAHAESSALTLIDLDGVDGAGSGPAIVDIALIFFGSLVGGFGLDVRPCDADAGPTPSEATLYRPANVSEDETDVEVVQCGRPLVYASLRYGASVLRFTANGVELEENVPGSTQSCASPTDLGEPGKIVCDPRVRNVVSIDPGLVPTPATGTTPALLGDVAFDETGDSLFVVQTSPGALLRVNTSLDTDNETFDSPAAPPLELCASPTRLVVDGDFGYVSCFQAALVYVIDLAAWSVADVVVVGTGPDALLVDPERQKLFVANTLESSVSVIELGPQAAFRFKEIARIGLQEPFSQ